MSEYSWQGVAAQEEAAAKAWEWLQAAREAFFQQPLDQRHAASLELLERLDESRALPQVQALLTGMHTIRSEFQERTGVDIITAQLGTLELLDQHHRLNEHSREA